VNNLDESTGILFIEAENHVLINIFKREIIYERMSTWLIGH